MRKYKTVYRIPEEAVKPLNGNGEHILTEEQAQGLLRLLNSRKRYRHCALHFRRRSYYRILHDSPVMGAYQREFSCSDVSGPYSKLPRFRSEENVSDETIEHAFTRVFPIGRIPKFVPVQYLNYRGDANPTDLDAKALKEMGAASVSALQKLAKSKPEERGRETVYNARIGDCVLALVTRKPDVSDYIGEKHSMLELAVFGPGNEPQNIASGLGVFKWGAIQKYAVSGGGLMGGHRRGLAYNLDFKGIQLKGLFDRENVLL
jgi:hypothetical protein